MTNLYKGDATMLINTNIKRIVGGGCEIKEVRYMDNVVWKKAIPYNFVYNLSFSNYVNSSNCKLNKISINNKEFSSSHELEIELEEKKALFSCKFMVNYIRVPEVTISITLNNTVIFDKGFSGYWGESDSSYPCECIKEFDTSLLRQNQTNIINISIK